MDHIIKDRTGIDPQCSGCEHLTNKSTSDGYCYMFKKRVTGCRINTARIKLQKEKKRYR